MGWNCTIAVVRGARVADLAPMGWEATPETVSWDDATSSGFVDVAAWERDDLLVLAGGPLDLVEHAEALGALGPTYVGLFHSVTDTYVWEVAGDVGRRSWTWSAHEEVDSLGTPHPAEAGVAQLDEDALFDLLRAGGLVYDEALEQATFTVLAGTRAPATAPPRKRKRFGLF